MKKLILISMTACALISFSGCAERTARVTTTEETTTVHRPAATTTTETQVVRPGY